MDTVDKALKAMIDGIKATAGMGKTQKTDTAQHQSTIYRSGDIIGLPMDLSDWKSLQILTPGANFGKFYFMDGFSQEGGSDIRR